MYHIISLLAQKILINYTKIRKTTKKKRVTAPILKPNNDQKPETFFGSPEVRIEKTFVIHI